MKKEDEEDEDGTESNLLRMKRLRSLGGFWEAGYGGSYQQHEITNQAPKLSNQRPFDSILVSLSGLQLVWLKNSNPDRLTKIESREYTESSGQSCIFEPGDG